MSMTSSQPSGEPEFSVIITCYYEQKSIDDVVTQFVCRVLAQAGLPQDHMFRWTGSATGKRLES